eukprot:3185247-Pyramimonas_sp.AAC.2
MSWRGRMAGWPPLFSTAALEADKREEKEEDERRRRNTRKGRRKERGNNGKGRRMKTWRRKRMRRTRKVMATARYVLAHVGHTAEPQTMNSHAPAGLDLAR